MLTRELTEADEAAAVALLTSACLGCHHDAPSATAFWQRWLIETTMLGSFDGDTLVALRAYDRIDNTTARLRVLVCGGETWDEAWHRASTAGVVAWARRARIDTIIAPLRQETAETWTTRAAWSGARRVGLGGADSLRISIDELERALA